MAGSRSFERGEDYFGNRQIGAIAEHKGTITAKVQGTRPYQVKLWIDKEELEYSCTCPVGADGEFCKHCVAVGLTWLEGGQLKHSGKGQAAPAMTMDDVRAYLLGEDKNALVEMLVDGAMEEDRLRQRLFLKAAKKGPRGIDVATYRRAIGLLRKVEELMVRLGWKAEFTKYLDEVRAAHKPKRNFMKLLDQARL